MFINKEDIKRFTSEDKVIVELQYKDVWFDYCPCEGLASYKADETCHSHVRIIDNVDHFIILSKPNFNHTDRPFQSDSEDVFCATKLIKTDIYNKLNDFNSSACIYKSTRLEINDELLFWLGGELILETKVNSYEECEPFIKMYLNK